MTTQLKVCSKCLKSKDLSEFHGNKAGLFERTAQCKGCIKSSYDPRKQAEKQIKYCYGITDEEYAAMMKRQHWCCALCELPFGEHRGTRPAIDHCHKTGKIRGIIHGSCNSGLGFFGDDPVLLSMALAYLHRGGSRI